MALVVMLHYDRSTYIARYSETIFKFEIPALSCKSPYPNKYLKAGFQI